MQAIDMSTLEERINKYLADCSPEKRSTLPKVELSESEIDEFEAEIKKIDQRNEQESLKMLETFAGR